MDKAKVAPTTMSDEELSDLITTHIAKMTNNTNFATPSPTPAEFAASTDPYVAAVADVKDLETQIKQAILLRDSLRPEAERAVLLRRDYVQQASGGRGEIILTSGFGIAGKPGPAAAPEEPEAFAASMGDLGGQVDLMWHRQRGRSFIVQYCEDPMNETAWKQAGVTTNSQFTVKGLVSGTKYWFRVCSLIGDTQSNWCDPALCMAP